MVIIKLKFLLQSNETDGSSKMEKQGPINCVSTISRDPDFTIKTLVTDRHPLIIKYVREDMKGAEHVFDVWHVAKGEIISF